MKTTNIKNNVFGILVISLFLFNKSFSQTETTKTKKSVTVLNIDSKGFPLDPTQVGNLVRIELDKLAMYEVMDRYDVMYQVDKNQIKIDNCYGKLCLVDIGKIIHSDKMFTGSVELLGETIIITMRLIDVNSQSIEKTQVSEFLNLPKDLPSMINIAIRTMYGLENNETLLTKLTKRFNYESAINNPTETRLRSDGPRMGVVSFHGQTGKIMKAAKSQGGFDAYPAMFQFGYQFEKQYLNEGNFQALFEFLPMVSGLEQSTFIPSFTLLNGLRDNKRGWEFAFGPTFNIGTFAEGYYENGAWKLRKEWDGESDMPIFETRLDSRGIPKLVSGFVFAFGKTFKSGSMNIPVNCFVIPNKSGVRIGASFGFNTKKKK